MTWSWLWMEMFIAANGLWPELFKFIAVWMETSDLQKFGQTPERSLDLFQTCNSLSMMYSKLVTNWINYLREFAFRELWEHSELDLIVRPIFFASTGISCLQLITEQLDFGSLGRVCSHGASTLFCFRVFLSVVFHFSISPCIFIIHIYFASYFQLRNIS